MNNICGINLISQNGNKFCQQCDIADANSHGYINFKGLNPKREARYALRWISKNFSSPQQRAVIGLTALCTQPFIDLHNRHIKKEDKSVVVAKTISKIIIGTCTGIAMRHYCIKAVKHFTKSNTRNLKYQFLLPTRIIAKLRRRPSSVSDIELNNYRNGLGTLFGVLGGMITNFLVDAPLTKMFTNTLNEKVFSKGVNNGK